MGLHIGYKCKCQHNLVPRAAFGLATTSQASPTAKREIRTYSSCDATHAAGEPRVQGVSGSGCDFPKWMLPTLETRTASPTKSRRPPPRFLKAAPIHQQRSDGETILGPA